MEFHTIIRKGRRNASEAERNTLDDLAYMWNIKKQSKGHLNGRQTLLYCQQNSELRLQKFRKRFGTVEEGYWQYGWKSIESIKQYGNCCNLHCHTKNNWKKENKLN